MLYVFMRLEGAKVIRRLLLLLGLGMIVFCLGACGRSRDAEEIVVEDSVAVIADDDEAEESEQPQGPRDRDRVRVNRIGSLAEVFNDSNYLHYKYAEKIGITPIENLHDAYFTSKPLVRLESCESYHLDELTHSVPYLVPQAAGLLKEIGDAFIDTLKRRGGDGYKVIVTSVLRTPSTVKRLRKVNRNATDSSTHMFATTFDITWNRFYCEDTTRTLNEEDLKNVLAEVLLDKRNEGRCLVKYERKSPCFHITAIK